MAKVTLSSDLQGLINEVKLLKSKEPLNQDLIDRYDQLVDLMEQLQDKEWEENFQRYVDAKSALEEANRKAAQALKDLAKTAKAIEAAADVIDKLAALAASAF